jgi:feruloyl esterase
MLTLNFRLMFHIKFATIWFEGISLFFKAFYICFIVFCLPASAQFTKSIEFSNLKEDLTNKNWSSNCKVSKLAVGLSKFKDDWVTSLDSAVWYESYKKNEILVSKHCEIRGVMGSHIGAPNQTRYGNEFLLRVPSTWNGRLVFQGGGGNNGVVGDALAMGKDGRTALELGFAVVAQDSGHKGRDPFFALDQQAYFDFAYAGVHKVTVLAKYLLAELVGSSPEKSYFVGCSNGGREALVSAQRYDDFDGVVAGSPGYATYDQWLQNMDVLKIISKVSGVPQGGIPQDTSHAYSDIQLNNVAEYFLAKCDALDGLKDGMVLHPQACLANSEDWKSLRCTDSGGTGKSEACLSSLQAEGLQSIYDGIRNRNGELIFPGFYPGHIERNLRQSYLGEAKGKYPVGLFYQSIMTNFPFMGYGFRAFDQLNGPADELISYPRDLRAYVANFHVDNTSPKLKQGRIDFGAGAVDENEGPNTFEKFRQRGGKMLIYTGTQDHGVQAKGVVRLYEKLIKRYGQKSTDDMSAIFLVPGMNHCRGGETTEKFDPLGAIVKWVENEERPERLVAGVVKGSQLYLDQPNLTRPLCAFPKFPKWNQKGNPQSHESFECVAP